MNTAWTYALRQLLGMQLEPFAYTSQQNVTYTWRAGFWQWVCRMLVGIGLTPIAKVVFVLTVERSTPGPRAFATIGKTLYWAEDGAFTVSFEYDDQTLRILTIRVVNNTQRDFVVSATATNTGRNYTLVIEPGVIDQPVPQTVVSRLQLSVVGGGKLDGVDWSIA